MTLDSGLCVSDENGTNTWPDVLKFLFDCANSPTADLRESALLILRLVFRPFSPRRCWYLSLAALVVIGT